VNSLTVDFVCDVWLKASRRQSHALEEQNQGLLGVERKLRSYIQVLEVERTALLGTISSLRHLVSDHANMALSTDDAGGLPISLADIDREVASLLDVHDQAASVVDNITLKIPSANSSSHVAGVQRARPSSANC